MEDADPYGTDRVHNDELPLQGGLAQVLRDDDSLIEQGVIDSTGILELIEFLESHFGVGGLQGRDGAGESGQHRQHHRVRDE